MEELIPIRNFAVVEEGKLYRSAQPMYDYEYKWLATKGIKTLVNLREEIQHDQKFAEQFGFKVIQVDIKDHFPPTLEQAQSFIELVKNSSEPILFHCEHGRGRTSTFCVLARVAQGWTLEDAIKEEQDRFGYVFQHQNQLEFLNSLK
jgi:protein tyrosine/serine phosphatase